MDKLRSGFHFIFASYKRTALVLVLGGLALAIPITLNMVSQQQDLRQRASQVCANVPADIMLVIDKSLSMNDKTSSTDTTTLLQKAKQAANLFIDTISSNTQNKAGLVAFSSESKTVLESSLTNNYSSVKQKVDGIAADGETCTQCGIKKANEQISSNKRNGIKNVVILLTDGRANARIGSVINSETAAEAAAINEAKTGKNTNGTVFFTIGLGNKVNSSFLQQIANETGGQYFFAPTANDLTSIYQQISQIVGKGSVSGFVFDDVNGNGTQDTNETKLNGWQAELKSNNQTTGISASTDQSGGFSITGVCDGEYVLTLKSQSGWTITTPQTGTYNIIITNGGPQTDKNFGVRQTNVTPTIVTPSATPSASPTATPSSTIVNLDLKLVGIGTPSSDSARLGINGTPTHPQRNIQAVVINSSNQQVASFSSTVNFDSTSGTYKGSLNLGNNFASGSYLIKVRLDNTLWKTIPGIQNITTGQTYNAPLTEMVSGDINQDNQINLTDYNIFISCYGDKECTYKVLSDFNDDGKIEELDLNILYTGFAKRNGD